MQNTTTNEVTRTVMVYYGNHDSGGQSEGHMIREAGESAERTANLLRQCGYRLVRIEG